MTIDEFIAFGESVMRDSDVQQPERRRFRTVESIRLPRWVIGSVIGMVSSVIFGLLDWILMPTRLQPLTGPMLIIVWSVGFVIMLAELRCLDRRR
jgi:amino acid transporter